MSWKIMEVENDIESLTSQEAADPRKPFFQLFLTFLLTIFQLSQSCISRCLPTIDAFITELDAVGPWIPRFNGHYDPLIPHPVPFKPLPLLLPPYYTTHTGSVRSRLWTSQLLQFCYLHYWPSISSSIETYEQEADARIEQYRYVKGHDRDILHVCSYAYTCEGN